MEGVPLPPGIPGLGGSTDPLEAVLGPFPCARLRNLPYDASIEDILALFQGLVVIDAVLVGQGEAFVIFANPMDFQMALQRTRQTIGRRFIEISSASRAEYYEAIATQHLQEQEMRRPQLTRGSGMTDQGTGDEPQQSGEAAAVAALWASQTSATPGGGPPQLHPPPPLQQMYGETMVPSGRGTPGGLTLAGPPGRPGSVGSRGPPGGLHAPLQKRTGGGIQVGEHTGFLRMRGLPFIASKEDILKFFEGYNPVPESIVLTYRNDGRATGEAYVGFSSPDDSRRAMELHRKTMGARYIELFISNKDEQGRALARFGNR